MYARAAKFDYLTTGNFRATILKIQVSDTVGLADYETTGQFGTSILKFQALLIRLLTVTTGLRPNSERLYPNFKAWRLVAYCDYATTDIFEECMPELLSLTT